MRVNYSQRCPKTGRYLPTGLFDYVGLDITAFGVYQITNIVNGKIYIGSCYENSFKARWLKHLERLAKNKHTNRHLQSAWNKYGKGNFIFSIKEELEPDQDTVLAVEQHYIDSEIQWQYDYNINRNTSGGQPPAISKDLCLEIIKKYLSNEVEIINDLVAIYGINKSTINKILVGKYPNSRDIELEGMIKACKLKSRRNVFRKSKEHNMAARAVTKEQAIEIYNTYHDCTITGKRKYYAEKYNTNPSTISDIAMGRTYNDWTGAPEYLKKKYKK